MADSEIFTRIAMSFDDVVSAPHFDRTAFKVKRIFATLAADGRSANINFTPEEQELKCMVGPDVFEAIDNGWGRQGWTTMWLEPASEDDVRSALAMAYVHGAAKRR